MDGRKIISAAFTFSFSIYNYVRKNLKKFQFNSSLKMDAGRHYFIQQIEVGFGVIFRMDGFVLDLTFTNDDDTTQPTIFRPSMYLAFFDVPAFYNIL